MRNAASPAAPTQILQLLDLSRGVLEKPVSGDIKPDFTGLQIQTATSTLPIPIVWGQNKVARQRHLVLKLSRRRRAAAARAACSASRDDYYLLRRPHHRRCAKARSAAIGYNLARPVDSILLSGLGLSSFNGTTPQIDLGLSRAQLPEPSARLSGHGLRLRRQLQSRRQRLDRQPQFRGPRRPRRHRRQRHRRRPGAGDLRFLDQRRNMAPASTRRASTGRPCSARAATDSLQTYCKAMGIAFRPGSSAPSRPSTRSSTRWLQILNCAAVWSGGKLQFHSLWRHRDRRGQRHAHLPDAVPIPSTDRYRAATYRRASRFARRARSCQRRRRHLRLHRRRARLHRRDERRNAGHIRHVTQRDLSLRRRRRGARSSRSPTRHANPAALRPT